MDMDNITELTEAISLALVGVHVAIFEQPFHKVITSIALRLLLMAVRRILLVHECKCRNLIGWAVIHYLLFEVQFPNSTKTNSAS